MDSPEVNAPVSIALDVMGAELGVEACLQGAIRAVIARPQLSLHLFGREGVIQPFVKHLSPELRDRLLIHHCTDEITMHDQASQAARTKKDSSMVKAVTSVAEGECKGVVTAGNSGAAMACALFILKRIPGIERPAITVKMPTTQGHCIMLDMGANVDAKPEHLVQFALMGNAYAETVDKISRPRVALLSNGEERHKGNDMVREASEILEQSALNYIGYVEGHDIHHHKADVVVCDGFLGNIVLKTSEGLAHAIMELFERQVRASLRGLAGAWMLLPAFRAVKKNLDASEMGAAPLLGIQGNMFICHGKSNARAFETALYIAYEAIRGNLADVIRQAAATMPSMAPPQGRDV